MQTITGVGGSLSRANRAAVGEIQIPLPPLEVQKEIVAEIEGYQKVIDGARAVVDHYRPQIPIHPDWPMVELGQLCELVQYGLSVPLNLDGAGFKTFRMNELVEGRCVDRGDMKYADIPGEEFAKYRLTRGDILFNRTNSFEHGRTSTPRTWPVIRSPSRPLPLSRPSSPRSRPSRRWSPPTAS